MTAGSKAVLITGCSTGIGGRPRAHLAKLDGFTVYATARKVESLADLEAAGCRTLALDVTDEASMKAAVDAVEQAERRGLGARQQRRLPPVGRGRVDPARLAAPAVRDQRLRPGPDEPARPARDAQGGRAAGSSTSARWAASSTFPGGGAYHATKYAVEALSDAMRFEVKGFGVDVVLIEPGLITTEFGDTAAGSVDATDEDSTARTRKFNAEVAKGDRGRLHGPAGEARRRPRDGRGGDREGADGQAAEAALHGHRRRRSWRSRSGDCSPTGCGTGRWAAQFSRPGS